MKEKKRVEMVRVERELKWQMRRVREGGEGMDVSIEIVVVAASEESAPLFVPLKETIESAEERKGSQL